MKLNFYDKKPWFLRIFKGKNLNFRANNGNFKLKTELLKIDNNWILTIFWRENSKSNRISQEIINFWHENSNSLFYYLFWSLIFWTEFEIFYQCACMHNWVIGVFRDFQILTATIWLCFFKRKLKPVTLFYLS